ELARESRRALAQLIARCRQHRREPRLGRALGEGQTLLPEFRPTVVIGEQHDLREARFAVHYLLPYVGTQPMEVSMKFTALAAALVLALSGALVSGCDRDGSKSASGGATSAPGSSGSSGASGSSSSGSSSTTPGGAPKRPASPGGAGGSSSSK